jgi:hypothetical protein
MSEIPVAGDILLWAGGGPSAPRPVSATPVSPVPTSPSA